MPKIVGAFSGGEAFGDVSESAPECFEGACGPFAERGLEFGEDLFDRVEIRAVGRQVEECRAGGFDGLADARDLVRAEIVHDDDITGPQGGDQHLLDIGEEHRAIDRAVEHAGRHQPVLTQGADEG